MAEKEVLLTKEGLEKLEAELDNLKNVKRIEVAQRIKIAIGFGDLSENSEYEDAKNEQAMVEGQIVELENKIRNARVIESDPTKRRISNESPVGEAIIGHKKGDVVQVAAPKGALQYKILEIS